MNSYRIRAAEPEDAAALAAMMNTPRAYSGTLQLPYPSVELWTERLSRLTDNGRTLLLAEAPDGTPVGHTGLWVDPKPRRRHVADFGIAVRDDWQGRGVGSALMTALVDLADNWLGLTRLELTVYTDNEAAIALYRRFGFEHEATCRAYALRGGRYVDVYRMARLRP